MSQLAWPVLLESVLDMYNYTLILGALVDICKADTFQLYSINNLTPAPLLPLYHCARSKRLLLAAEQTTFFEHCPKKAQVRCHLQLACSYARIWKTGLIHVNLCDDDMQLDTMPCHLRIGLSTAVATAMAPSMGSLGIQHRFPALIFPNPREAWECVSVRGCISTDVQVNKLLVWLFGNLVDSTLLTTVYRNTQVMLGTY